MLSRLAEHLYWIGRYMERADDTTRLATALYRGMTQVGWEGDVYLAADLLGVLGSSPNGSSPNGSATGGSATGGSAGGEAEAERLSLNDAVTWCVCDLGNPSSVLSCLKGARENTRRAREVLSLELWETINAASMEIDLHLAAGAGVEDYLRDAPWWTRSYFGVVDSALLRDEARSVMRLGCYLERADMILRVLMLGAEHLSLEAAADPFALHFWSMVLRACGAQDAYRQAVAGPLEGLSVAELLLRNPQWPRSVLYALRRAEETVGGQGERARLLGQLRSELEFRRTEELAAGGATAFQRLLDNLDKVHAAVVAELLRPSELL
jgi:uncharacterized alpha-E superfamily protein